MRREWILFLALAVMFGTGVLVGATFFAGEAAVERSDRGRSVSGPVIEQDAESERSSRSISSRAATAIEPLTPDTPRPALIGRVETRSGEPVAGLELVLTPVDGGTVLETTTDTGGRFSVLADPQSRYSPAAKSSSWVLANRSGREADPVSPGIEAVLTASPAFALEVDVLLPNGARPDEVDVSFRRGTTIFQRRWTTADSTFYLPRGIYELRAFAKNGARSNQAAAIVDGEDRDRVILRLESPDSKLRVTGRVLAGGRERWHDVSIELDDSSIELSPSQDRFEFTVRKPGEYSLVLRRGNTRALVHPITIEQSEYVELFLPPLDESNSATVLVLDPWGDPVSDFRLQIEVLRPRGRSTGGIVSSPIAGDVQQRVFYSPDVLDVFLGRKPGEVLWNLFTLEFGVGAVTAPAPRPGGHHTFRLQLPASVEFVCETGEGFLGDEDRLVVQVSLPDHTRGLGIDERGIAKLPFVQPGEYEARYAVYRGDSSTGIASLPATKFRAEPGPQKVPLPMPRLFDMAVELEGIELTSIQLSFQGEDAWFNFQPSLEGGVGRIPYLTAGTFDVNSRSLEDLDETITVPQQRVFVIRQ